MNNGDPGLATAFQIRLICEDYVDRCPMFTLNKVSANIGGWLATVGGTFVQDGPGVYTKQVTTNNGDKGRQFLRQTQGWAFTGVKNGPFWMKSLHPFEEVSHPLGVKQWRVDQFYGGRLDFLHNSLKYHDYVMKCGPQPEQNEVCRILHVQGVAWMPTYDRPYLLQKRYYRHRPVWAQAASDRSPRRWIWYCATVGLWVVTKHNPFILNFTEEFNEEYYCKESAFISHATYSHLPYDSIILKSNVSRKFLADFAIRITCAEDISAFIMDWTVVSDDATTIPMSSNYAAQAISSSGSVLWQSIGYVHGHRVFLTNDNMVGGGSQKRDLVLLYHPTMHQWQIAGVEDVPRDVGELIRRAEGAHRFESTFANLPSPDDDEASKHPLDGDRQNQHHHPPPYNPYQKLQGDSFSVALPFADYDPVSSMQHGSFMYSRRDTSKEALEADILLESSPLASGDWVAIDSVTEDSRDRRRRFIVSLNVSFIPTAAIHDDCVELNVTRLYTKPTEAPTEPTPVLDDLIGIYVESTDPSARSRHQFTRRSDDATKLKSVVYSDGRWCFYHGALTTETATPCIEGEGPFSRTTLAFHPLNVPFEFVQVEERGAKRFVRLADNDRLVIRCARSVDPGKQRPDSMVQGLDVDFNTGLQEPLKADTITSTTFMRNRAQGEFADVAAGAFAVMHDHGQLGEAHTLIMKNTKVKGNRGSSVSTQEVRELKYEDVMRSASVGGIAVESHGMRDPIVDMDEVQFWENSGDTGAVQLRGCDAVMRNAKIRENHGRRHAGGMTLRSGNITIDRTRCVQNEGFMGGCINADLTTQAVSFAVNYSNNRAQTIGHAVSGSLVVFQGTTIDNDFPGVVVDRIVVPHVHLGPHLSGACPATMRTKVMGLMCHKSAPQAIFEDKPPTFPSSAPPRPPNRDEESSIPKVWVFYVIPLHDIPLLRELFQYVSYQTVHSAAVTIVSMYLVYATHRWYQGRQMRRAPRPRGGRPPKH